MTDPCIICNQPITDNDWDWAAMQENGPVHTNCRMTDDQLRAEFDDDCKRENLDVLHYRDGVNNADIYADGRIERLYGGVDRI